MLLMHICSNIFVSENNNIGLPVSTGSPVKEYFGHTFPLCPLRFPTFSKVVEE